jgi:thiosulfate/3-mercaptopyruvate sulfurtransferase
MADYAHPDLIVDAAWLADHLSDANVRIIEMTQDPAPFEDGHIPGAVAAPDWQIKGSENKRLVAPPDEAAAWFESVGISDDTLVIGYDRLNNRDASRLWWVLNYYGHANVKVLNGGWSKWSGEGRAVEKGPSMVSTSGASFTPKPADQGIESTVDKLKAAIDDDDAVIWDVRAREEFTGENARGNARVGHVPTAVHLEWTDLNNPDHTFKSPDEIMAILAPLGITPDKAVHTY